MPDFAVHFFICNIFISIGIGIISIVRHLLKKYMSARPLFTDPGSIFTEANDFAVSVSSRTPLIPLFLLILWISGMAVVSFFTLRSFSRRRILEKSALPVQNPQVQDY